MLQDIKRYLILFKPFRFLYIVLLLPIGVFADTNSHHYINKAAEMFLWEETEWLNLLHYNKEHGGYLSQVDDSRFFYANDGKKSPEAELIATINNLFETTNNHNIQTQCKFVARTKWLTEQLDIDKEILPTVKCDEYLEWRQLVQADSVTMVFPAYHLNSPSSMFGHTLLRLDNSKNDQTNWLSYAVNFGADINNDDNSLLYAFRGLAGGYPGIFISEPYFKKIQEYNRIEHRDIWEYKLNLTADETENMIKHLWELKTINFDYYFFDENCSYRLLELIEVARPNTNLTEEFIITAIPVDTVRAVENAQLVESVSYHPARATEIQSTLEIMSEQHRFFVLSLSKDIAILESKDFTTLPIRNQKSIVDLSYKYLRYQNTKKARNPEAAKRSYQLLQKLNSYPVGVSSETIITPLAPEKAHKSKRTTFGVGQRLDNNYAEIGFKMAFHDLEDNNSGFLQGAQINVMSAKFRIEDNVGLRLHQFDLIDVFSLTPRNDFFKPLSWKIYSGFERQLTRQKDQLTYHLTGGAGGTWQLIKNHQFYALAIGRLEINKQLKNAFEPAFGFDAGFLSHFTNTTAHLEFSGEQFQDDVYRLRAQYTQNFVFTTNHSIKITAKHQWQEDDIDFSDININYQYYF